MQDEMIQGHAIVNNDGEVMVFVEDNPEVFTHFTSDGDVIRLIGRGSIADVRHYGPVCTAAIARCNAIHVTRLPDPTRPEDEGASRTIRRRR